VTTPYHALASPLLIGHRGLNTVAPENTLEAIEAAADQGAHGVEVDVRQTADGALVVFHDRDLWRLARCPDRIEDIACSRLTSVNLGGGARVPRLADVLRLCADRGLLLNVELKRDVPARRRLVDAVATTLQQLAQADQPLVVSSFDPAMLRRFRSAAPDTPIAVLYTKRHRWVRWLATPLSASALHPPRELVERAEVARAHAAARRVMTWTVNDVDEARRLLAQGVDGIMTDDPAALRGLFDSPRAHAP
jgi:glycerophosphoryl diester phosphodiesterase